MTTWTSTGLKITFKFFTEVLFLSIILCLANTGIVNVLVSTLYSKPDEVTGYECGLYSTKSNNGCFKIVPLDTLGGVVPING